MLTTLLLALLKGDVQADVQAGLQDDVQADVQTGLQDDVQADVQAGSLCFYDF